MNASLKDQLKTKIKLSDKELKIAGIQNKINRLYEDPGMDNVIRIENLERKLKQLKKEA